MSRRNSHHARHNPRPLDAAALDALAVAYVGRYATTQARLHAYLARKLLQRGWAGEGEPPLEAIVARCAAAGYVDDAGFAAARGAALARRGFGEARVGAALRAVGIAADVAEPVRAAARDHAMEAALTFARRKHIGPFGSESTLPDVRRRHLGQLLRAGHPLAIARRIAFAEPGEELDDR